MSHPLANIQGNSTVLWTQCKSVLSNIWKAYTNYCDVLQNQNEKQRSRNRLLVLLNHFTRWYLDMFARTVRWLYWLLGPNMLFKLCIRHLVLFLLMLQTPSMIRLTIQPLWKYVRYHILLRLLMGKEWVVKYTQIKQQIETPDIIYKDYAHLASKLDEMNGLDSWRINKTSSLYSHHRIHQDLIVLNKFRQKDQMRELMEFLRSRIGRNYCGITNPALYSVTKIGTKTLIEDFIDNICQSLQYIANAEDPSISVGEKIVFFKELRHVLGRTALCLSGGATLGSYHIGAVLTMHRNNLLPKIITGSSVGSIVAAIVCTKSERELETLLKDGNLNFKYFDRKQSRRWITGIYVRCRRFWQTGYFLDITVLRDCMRDNIGDITFLEAYQQTGRILNVTVSGGDANTMPRLLNFLNAPHVVIWSAVIASCAIPLFFAPQELFVKTPGMDKIEPVYLQGVTFSDGSVSHDLPMDKLAMCFNVDNFIVSQVNPHLVPFLFHSIVAPIPLFEKLFRFLGDEFHLILTTVLVSLREFGIGGLAPMNNLFTQKYTGDVTIVPDIPATDYLRILSNPSLKYVNHCDHVSRKSTFKHISRLQGLCATEFTIDQCLKHLRSQLVSHTVDIHRISSFEIPRPKSKTRFNTLHIPQDIYNSIVSNIPSDEIHSIPESEEHIPETNVLPRDDSESSIYNMHQSLSVAELCSDLSNVV
eukprot:256632_1